MSRSTQAIPQGSPDNGVAMAHRLADVLEAGGRPPQVRPPFPLQPGESCYANVPVDMYMWTAPGDGSYVSKTRIMGGWAGLAVGAATIAGNQRRKAQAGRNAREQWVQCQPATMYFTDHRLLSYSGEWSDLSYVNIVSLRFDGVGILLESMRNEPRRWLLPDVHYHFVLLHWLAYRQVIRPPGSRPAAAQLEH